MSGSSKYRFVSLSELLYDKKVDVDIVRFLIEWKGVYLNKHGASSINKIYDQESGLGIQALSLIDKFEMYSALMRSSYPREEFNSLNGNVIGWFENNAELFLQSVIEEKNRNIRTLYFLINKKAPISFSALIYEIEANGIWANKGKGGLINYSPDSLQAAEAIHAVSNSAMVATTMQYMGQDSWAFEESGIYTYGWPSESVPRFDDLNEDNWFQDVHTLKNFSGLYKENLYTVGRLLLQKKTSIANLIKAIELFGIDGFDDYGNPESLRIDDPRLDALKNDLRQYSSILIKGGVPNINVFDNESFCRFGWPRKKLPLFSELPLRNFLNERVSVMDGGLNDSLSGSSATESATTEAPHDPTENGSRSVILTDVGQISYSKEQSYQAVIGGLLAYIVGGQGSDAHRNFRSERQLRLWVENKIGIRGSGEGTSKKIFKAAKVLLAENNINLPNDDSDDQPEDDRDSE